MEFPRVSIKRQNEAITQSGGMEMFPPVEEFAQQIARSTDAAITSCLGQSSRSWVGAGKGGDGTPPEYRPNKGRNQVQSKL